MNPSTKKSQRLKKTTKARFFLLIIFPLFICSCATVDPAYQRYEEYVTSLNWAVARGELTPADAATMKYQAYTQYQQNKIAEQQGRTARLGALGSYYGGLAQMEQAKAAQTEANRPVVVGGGGGGTVCHQQGSYIYCT